MINFRIPLHLFPVETQNKILEVEDVEEDLSEKTEESEKVVFLGIHRGVLVSIIPFGLGLISYRFFIIAIESLTKLINPTWQPVGESNSEGD